MQEWDGVGVGERWGRVGVGELKTDNARLLDPECSLFQNGRVFPVKSPHTLLVVRKSRSFLIF